MILLSCNKHAYRINLQHATMQTKLIATLNFLDHPTKACLNLGKMEISLVRHLWQAITGYITVACIYVPFLARRKVVCKLSSNILHCTQRTHEPDINRKSIDNQLLWILFAGNILQFQVVLWRLNWHILSDSNATSHAHCVFKNKIQFKFII